MSSTNHSSNAQKRPSKLWWLLAILVLLACILIQLPLSWIIQKYMPNTPYIQWVSGNLWQGSATWQLPNAPANSNSPIQNSPTQSNLQGSLNWQWKPLKLAMGKLSADIEISSGQSRLTGEINTGVSSLFGEFNNWQMHQLSGRVHQSTLAQLINWQLPDSPVQINNLSIAYTNAKGFSDTSGQLTWVGGQLGYPNAGKILHINLPAMIANINDDKNVLNINLLNQQEKALGNLKVSPDGMLDVNLTQRLLENMPSYKGSAPKDTAVVSVRQPLSTIGK